ncbi:MAG: hypothetical protein J7551_06495 [Chloroflexi bacterium]|nr:hypothetical protein [Chloroflexota bacterium]
MNENGELLRLSCGIARSVLYWQGMESELSPEHLERVREWLRQKLPQLRRIGLDSLMETILESPFGFLASQGFLLIQPFLNHRHDRNVYESLVRLLNTPEGTEWLRKELAALNERGTQR